jgi:VWFA-related protein
MKAAQLLFSFNSSRSILLATILACTCASGFSQEKTPASRATPNQEPSSVLKVTTRLVTVDVVARDRHGNPVRDLKPGEFQITEQAGSKKSPQNVASFRLLDRSLSKAPDAEKAVLQLPAGVFTNLITTKNLSAPPTILLVDGLNTESGTQLQVRQKMVRLLASSPSDVPMAVFLLGRELRLLQSFTTDPKLLRAAAEQALTLEASGLQAKDARDDTLSHSSLLEQMAGAEGSSDTPGGPPGPQPGSQGSTGGGNSNALLAMRALQLQRFEREQYADSMDVRVKKTLDALRVLARHVSGYPGRKNLIWLSSAFPLAISPDASLTMVARFSGMRNYSDDLTAVGSALTDAQIAVYPVDPRGIETQALFDPSSRGKLNPFSEGATLGRESDARFSTQESMQDLAAQTGGQVCVNNNDLAECIRRAINDSSSYYELSYYPTDKNWHGEFRRIAVKTTRPGVRLSFREGYFARDSDANISSKETKDTDARLAQAACNDYLTATSIMVEASPLQPDQPGQAKYFILIDPNAVTISAPEGGTRTTQLEVATCMFNARGIPLQYNRQSIGQKFNEKEFEFVMAHGVSHSIAFEPKPETARVRLLVCDTRTGMIGSVDIPYPADVVSKSSGKSEGASGETAKAASQGASPGPAAPHLIKFHDKAGHTGILRWDSTSLTYSGDLSAEDGARGLFDSLWAKSYRCSTGKLLSLNGNPAPPSQPLHFRTDDSHVVEVYLDAPDGVKFSGNIEISDGAKPMFEALRSLFQCKGSVGQTPN